MVRIRDADPKKSSRAYHRLFGNEQLGDLITKAHSTVISAGNELEKIIADKVENKIADLDEFLSPDPRKPQLGDGAFLAQKTQIKKCKTLNFPKGEPDFMVFVHRGAERICYTVELKDGYVFDTKKAAGELEAMNRFIEKNGPHIQYQCKARFCAFNQHDHATIRDGFKRVITIEEAMTGREFCELLGIDYDTIVKERQADCADNLEHFLEEIAKIDDIREPLLKALLEKN